MGINITELKSILKALKKEGIVSTDKDYYKNRIDGIECSSASFLEKNKTYFFIVFDVKHYSKEEEISIAVYTDEYGHESSRNLYFPEDKTIFYNIFHALYNGDIEYFHKLI